MPFSVQCPNCSAKLKAKDELVGKKVPCPKCKHAIVVQAPEPQRPAPAKELKKNDVPTDDGGHPVVMFDGTLKLLSSQAGAEAVAAFVNPSDGGAIDSSLITNWN